MKDAKKGNFTLLDLKIGISVYDQETDQDGIVVQPFSSNNLFFPSVLI